MSWYHVMPDRVLTTLRTGYRFHNISRRQRLAERCIVRAAEAVSETCVEVASLEAWTTLRRTIKARLAWMLGLDPQPERACSDAEVTAVLERSEYTIEKLLLQSVPGLYVTCNYYRPRGASEPLPCVIYLCGHWPSLRGAKTGYQDRYLWYPANGFSCLVVDPLEFGEVPGLHHGTSRSGFWHWLSLGYTPAGVEVWNAMRALDWLQTRPEIDASRIGVTGISGGGVSTHFLAALDDRVAVAAPSCSTYTIGDQAASRVVADQCDCTYFPNIHRIDFPTVAALIAPRPLLITGGRKDPLFPPSGFRAAYRHVARIYALYGNGSAGSDRIRLVESPAGHTDTPTTLHESHKWLSKWLNANVQLDPGSVDLVTEAEPDDLLTCVRDKPLAPINFWVDQTWIERSQPCLPEDASGWEDRRRDLIATLKATILGWRPREPFPFHTRQLRNSGGSVANLADFGEYEFDAEPGVPINTCVLRPRGNRALSSLLVWVKRPGDQEDVPGLDEILPLLADTAVAAVTPRFADHIFPAREFSRIERTAALVGRTVAAMRIWDIMRAITWTTEEMGINVDDVVVYGRGEAAVIGLYAALFDSRIGRVVMRDPPASHEQAPALLTVLRTTDIPEVAGALAPRRLSFLRSYEAPFDWTRSAYQLAGADECFSIDSTLADAVLNGRSQASRGRGRRC